MRSVIIHTYKKASAVDITSVIRRQLYKVWDHGDTVTYCLPGGRMTTYQYIDRRVNAEVLEPMPIGWSAPSAPAVVYEAEVGLTKDPNIVLIGDYVRTCRSVQISGYSIDDSLYNDVSVGVGAGAPTLQQQQSPLPRTQQQHVSKIPRHSNQFKRQQQHQHQTNSIPLASYLHVKDKESDGTPNRRKLHPKIPPMSIPLMA